MRMRHRGLKIRAGSQQCNGHFPENVFKNFECPIPKVLTDMEKKTSCDCYFFPVLAVGGHWSEVEGRPGEGGQARAPGGRGDTHRQHRQPAAAPSGGSSESGIQAPW